MSEFELFIQLYFALVGALLSVGMAWILRQNGRVLEAMKENTRMLGEKLDEGFRRMDEGLRRMDEGLRRMDERAEQRHKEVVELLRTGFGEVLRKIK